MSANRAAMNLRITLDGIKTLSYNCDDVNILLAINTEMEKILTRFKSSLPNSEGLVLRPATADRAKRALKRARKRCAALPQMTKRGRPRMNSRYRSRVGKKAQQHRKVLKFTNCNNSWLRIHYVFV